jgi:hypothetical protein
VTASFYPFEYVAKQIGKDLVTVTNLTQPGAEPHDLELAPRAGDPDEAACRQRVGQGLELGAGLGDQEDPHPGPAQPCWRIRRAASIAK